MLSYLYKKFQEWGNYYRNVDNQYGSTLYPTLDSLPAVSQPIEYKKVIKSYKEALLSQPKILETDQPSLSTCSSMTPQRNESCTSSSSSSTSSSSSSDS